jgi:hypothetical protein
MKYPVNSRHRPSVVRVVGAGLVAGRRGGRDLALTQPGGDDGVAAGDRLVVGVVAVGDVVGEQ